MDSGSHRKNINVKTGVMIGGKKLFSFLKTNKITRLPG